MWFIFRLNQVICIEFFWKQMYIGLTLMKARINVVFLLHCVRRREECFFQNSDYLQCVYITYGVGQLGTSTQCFNFSFNGQKKQVTSLWAYRKEHGRNSKYIVNFIATWNWVVSDTVWLLYSLAKFKWPKNTLRK